MTVDDRVWLKSHKSWRIILSLSMANTMLAPVLTNMIDKQFRCEISNESIQVEIDPAAITDVPHKKKVFYVVIETVYEHQRSIGALLTGLVGKSALLTIQPAGTQPVIPPKPEILAPRTAAEAKGFMKGLHVLFNNPKFQGFVGKEAGTTITTPADCKGEFKRLAGVESCKDLTAEQCKLWLDKFNAWVNGR